MTPRQFSLLPLTFVVAALPLAGGCRKSEAESAHEAKAEVAAAAPIAVKEVVAQQLKVPRTLTLSGSLIGSEEAKVAAGAMGKVVSTHVERGSVVRKGTVLVRLDARAAGAQAKLDCARTEQMFQKGAISKADYDKTHTACETSKWSVSAADARKTLTAEALRDTEIKAPFNGMIVERFVSPGEYVRADSPVVSLVDVDALRVELTVPEADVINVKQGMIVEFHTASNDNGPAYRGKIRYVGPSVRQQTRDAVVEAAIENPGHDLRPGMFVTAHLALGEQSLPAVPEAAVRTEGTLRHVFTVSNGRLEDHLVQVDLPRGGLVPVVAGIKAGDKVVAEVSPDMRDGAWVK